jgi:hypothetical protein
MLKTLSTVALALLLLGLAPLPRVQAQTLLQFGPRLGLDFSSDVSAGDDGADQATALFVGGDARITFLDGPLTVNPAFDYYFADGPGDQSRSLSIVSMNFIINFAPTKRAAVVPYVGSGTAVVIESITLPQGEVSQTHFSLSFVGGVEINTGRVSPFLELGFKPVFSDIYAEREDANFLQVRGGLLVNIWTR